MDALVVSCIQLKHNQFVCSFVCSFLRLFVLCCGRTQRVDDDDDVRKWNDHGRARL